jgi:hypothetical protein
MNWHRFIFLLYDLTETRRLRAEMGVASLFGYKKLELGVWTTMRHETSVFVRFCVVSLAILLLLGGISAAAFAQTAGSGSLSGTIQDAKGGVIPGVAVTLRNEGTGIEFPTSSNEAGLFIFPALPVGVYNLAAEKPGFATLSQKGIRVDVGSKVNLDLSLPLASTQSTIEITAETPIIETTRTQVSSTVNEVSIQNLPVNGRNFEDFVLLTPGVTKDVRQGDISFAGQRGTLNSLLVDGADDNNTFFGHTTGRIGSGRAPYQFSQDAVQEFQVNSSSYTAEIGRAGGAVINVVTKSGTNQFHGTVFEYFRDRALNANDLINRINSKAKSPYHFDQFGGTLGGPVVKDKIFFFFNYDGQRNTIPNIVVLNVPKNFALSSDATTASWQQAALAYLNARAASWTRTQNQDVYLGKVDWQVSQKQLVTVRWNSQRFTGAGFENGGPQNSSEHTGASLVQTDSLTASLTSTIKNNLLNVFRFEYRKDNEPGQANNVDPEATVKQGVNTVLIVGRNFFSPRFTNIRGFQWADTLSLIRGTHTFKFGGDFLYDQIANFFPGNFSGVYAFSTLSCFGQNLAGVTTPIPADIPPPGTCGNSYLQAFAGTGTTGPTTQPNMLQIGAFVQDEWRARSNLTFNYGVRYDIQKVAQPSTTNPAALTAGFNTGNIHIPKNGLEPRIGIAYTPRDNKKLVLRTGYGIYYGNTPSIMFGTAISNNGLNVQTLTYSGGNVPFYPNTKCGAPIDNPSCQPPSGGKSSAPIIYVVDPNYKQPFLQQYSAGAEYQLFPSLSVSVSYIGVKANHLQRTRDINLPQPRTCDILVNNVAAGTKFTFYPGSSGNCPLTTSYEAVARPAAAFGRVLQFEGTANSVYNGLAIQVSQRLSHNIQFTASYTLGRVTDDDPDATAVVAGGSDDAKLVQFPTNPHDDNGPGINDQRHRFVGSFVWDLDGYTHGMCRGTRLLVGGWQFGGIFTAASGQPYSPLVSLTDLNNDGNSRSDRFPGVGRDSFHLPNFVSFDPRLTKNINITERMKVQLFAELFNAFNRSNIATVNTGQYTRNNFCAVTPPAPCPVGTLQLNLNPSKSLGTPLSTAGPRIGQLAAKFIF